MKSEKEKAENGELYNANYDKELLVERDHCKELCFEYNHLHPSCKEERNNLLRSLLGKTGDSFLIEPPFYCDYGYNIEIGENFLSIIIVSSLMEQRLLLVIMFLLLPDVAFIRQDIHWMFRSVTRA